MSDRIVETHKIYEGWFNVLCVHAEIAGEKVTREVVEHPSGAAVLAYDPEKRLALLVAQVRPPVLASCGEGRMIEVIGGALDGDAPEDCARREALEEAGVRLNRLEHVAHTWATPATSTERVDSYLAEYSQDDLVASGGGLDEEQEHLKVLQVPLAELWRDAEQGRVRDAKTLLLVQALRIRKPHLFDGTSASV
jgi:nudix-type nucleoside diphosphatase (YffH/AdpP family)